MTEENPQAETDRYWQTVVQEWAASGVGMERWCRQTGLSFYQFRYYKRKFAKRFETTQLRNTFAEALDPNAGSTSLTLCVGNIRIEVGPGFDSVLLKQVVLALGGSLC